MLDNIESEIPEEVESKLNELIQELEDFPSKTKEEFSSNLNASIVLLSSIKAYDLMSCLLRAKTLEWLLHFTLRFKHAYADDDSELSNLVIVITELLLINTKAASLLNFELSALPENLPEFILNNETPETLQKHIDEKFNKMFSFFLKKTEVNDSAVNLIKFNYFKDTATKHIQDYIKDNNDRTAEPPTSCAFK